MSTYASGAVESPDAFRSRLRTWLAEHVGAAQISALTPADRRRLTASLYDAGLAGVTWPRAYGGRDLPPEYQTIFNEETAAYEGAFVPSGVTVGVCAATLLDFGTEAQKGRHVPRMLRGDEGWVQLLSEPGAGSDLASASTRAELDGDEFILNGQKVWTSLARESDFAFALVRTDRSVARHAGLSMLIVDLRAPGIDIRPLREMTGDALFNEVFLDDVRVPAANLVGELGGGWAVLSNQLAHEREALSAGTTGRRMDEAAFPRLVELARARGKLEDPLVRQGLAEVFIQQRLLDLTGERIREAAAADRPMGPVGSLAKIGSTAASRAAAELGVAIGGLGVLAHADDDDVAARYARTLLHFPMTGIAGGTTEIQKNIVAERLLGLPRLDR